MESVEDRISTNILLDVCSVLSNRDKLGCGDVVDYIEFKLNPRGTQPWPLSGGIVSCLVAFDFSKKDYASLRTD
jgi:hypothetical protein